jgi:hypothetical protein
LSLKEIQIDRNHFPINTIDLQNAKVLVQPEQAYTTEDKNVVIGDKRIITANEEILSHEVVLEKAPNRKESLKITVKTPALGGRGGGKPTNAKWCKTECNRSD